MCEWSQLTDAGKLGETFFKSGPSRQINPPSWHITDTAPGEQAAKSYRDEDNYSG
jgi:hypothetical protein